MPKDNVIEFKKPEPFVDDPITEVLRTGARKLLAEALEAEIEGFLCQYRDLRDDQDRKRVVRNGHVESTLSRLKKDIGFLTRTAFLNLQKMIKFILKLKRIKDFSLFKANAIGVIYLLHK